MGFVTVIKRNLTEWPVISVQKQVRNVGKSDGQVVKASASQLRIWVSNHTGIDLPVYSSAGDGIKCCYTYTEIYFF